MKRRSLKRVLSLALTLVMLISCVGGLRLTASATAPTYDNAEDIGHPTFKNTEGLAELLNVENNGASLSDKDIMMKIYEKDLADGGDSFYVDRVLARYGVASGSAGNGGNDDGNTFLTRGRALYMNTSTPSVIGFGGNPAYHQPLGGGNLYAVTFAQNGSGLRASEQSANRVNMPSNWYSTYSLGSTGVTAQVTKFISEQNVAFTAITLVNEGSEDVALTMNAASNYVNTPGKVTVNGAEVDELTGSRWSPSNLTLLTPRLMGEGFVLNEDASALTREITVPAGGSVETKVLLAMTTKEIPECAEDYVRFAELSNAEAIRTQKAEYNLYWAQNIPYINVPNPAVEKAILYRWWSERFNSLDANIPGYDYQYPITIEGVLGYNNAIILTQPMHMQDTKWLRSPYLIYGALLSAGNSSQSSAFLDNPGNRSNWNNHYGQYIAQSGTEAFYVVGGGAEMAENLAYYFGHDATGQLDHYGNHINGQKLITYQNNYMTGNDADTISMAVARGWKAHGENAYVWAAADRAAELYTLLGDTEKAAEYRTLADEIRQSVLDLLWCDVDQKFETYGTTRGDSHNSDNTHLVKVTESNNYNYFAVGMVPQDEESIAKYGVALRTFKNGKEFPIFPMFTANQIDNQTQPGSNNFSNINFTVQARAYEAAYRTYDTAHQYVTGNMLGLMTEWMAWLIYPNSGDIRYPNNSEFYNIDGSRTIDAFYRSWIYHNILGNYNYIFFEDMAGITPRADEKIELFPIDMEWDHFLVNNARYHGHDLTVSFDKIGDGVRYYDDLPEGYSLFLDGELVLTLDSLAHVVFDPATGEAEIEGEGSVLFSKGGSAIPTALDTVITDERTLQLMSLSGMYQKDDGTMLENLAEGAQVTATYTPANARAASWAEKHRADGSDSTSKAVNEEKPDPQAVVDGTTVDMPFWGNDQSPNAKDSLTLKLAEPKTVDMAALYFYNDRQSGGYSEPAKYQIEYLDGAEWKTVPTQDRFPGAPQANQNVIYFEAVSSDQFRFTFTNAEGHFTAVTEIQLFSEGGDRTGAAGNEAPTVTLAEDSSLAGNLRTGVKATVADDGKPYDKDTTYLWEVVSKPEGAEVILANADTTVATVNGTLEGDYTLRFTVSDGELEATDTITVSLVKRQTGGLGEDVAPLHTDTAHIYSDYTASWENLYGIANRDFEPTSSNMGTRLGWGNWPQDTGSEHYIGYRWDDPVTIGGFDVYWYDDGGGTRVPSNFKLQYLETADGEWKDVILATQPTDAMKTNQYNRVMFYPVTCVDLRFIFTTASSATGVYRWKVYASVNVERLEEIEIATTPGVIPAIPGSVTGFEENGNRVSVPVTWDTVTADMVATDGQVVINGINSATGLMTKCTIYVRSDLENAIITSVDPVTVYTDPGVVPTLPRTVRVGYNDGAYDSVSVSPVWPEITPEQLANPGSYNFEGEVPGTTTKALLTIIVRGEIDPDLEAAQAVDGLILEIPEPVTLESGPAIEAAREAYDALTEEQKALVENYLELLEAEAEYARLLAEAAEAQALADARQAARQAAEAYAELIGALGLDEEARQALAELLEQGLEDIEKAESIRDVLALLDALLDAMDELRPTEQPFRFEDVQDESLEYFDAVYWAYNHDPQITSGTDETHFTPDKELDRKTAMTFLYAAAGKPEFDVDSAEKTFSDVKPGKWYTKAILWAANQDPAITAGNTDGSFGINTVCKTGHMLTFLYAQQGKPEFDESSVPEGYVAEGKWYTAAAKWAYAKGIYRAEGDKFVQSVPCTRATTVLYLYRALTGQGLAD
ncbi:MAG: discoidin domain-containing protein [Oscillospiraceae bacterium]|nr:discoidin domain-containing protein [Oscillospiraceae bacterium]